MTNCLLELSCTDEQSSFQFDHSGEKICEMNYSLAQSKQKGIDSTTIIILLSSFIENKS